MSARPSPIGPDSLIECAAANFLVKYTKKETDNALDGDSALELTTHNYGRDEWWLLLDPASPS